MFVISFGVLGWIGGDIYRQAPPMPERVMVDGGGVLYARADIERGRQVWQTTGGQQLGSIWGHGAYVAPDWSADWLHREATTLLDLWAQAEYQRPFGQLSAERQAALQVRLQAEMRRNTYDPATGACELLPVDAARVPGPDARDHANTGGDAGVCATHRHREGMAGAAGFEPATYGFGDRRSTS